MEEKLQTRAEAHVRGPAPALPSPEPRAPSSKASRLTGKHPFAEPAHRGNNAWLSAMTNDERDAFFGPGAIGKILDDVLVAEPSRRMPIAEVVAALGTVPFGGAL